jgi:hypothetical protein
MPRVPSHFVFRPGRPVVAAATLIRRRGPLVLVERQCNRNVETAAELASSRRIRMATGGSRANRLWPLCYSPVVAAEPPDGLILDTSGTCQSTIFFASERSGQRHATRLRASRDGAVGSVDCLNRAIRRS